MFKKTRNIIIALSIVGLVGVGSIVPMAGTVFGENEVADDEMINSGKGDSSEDQNKDASLRENENIKDDVSEDITADINIETRVDFSYTHGGNEGDYRITSGIKNSLYRLDFDVWKNLVEQTYGNNLFDEEVRRQVILTGEKITSWESTDSATNIKSLKPGIYCIVLDGPKGNNGITTINVYDDGSVRYAPEYDSDSGWGKSGRVDEGNTIWHTVDLSAKYDIVSFYIEDSAGRELTQGAQVEVYRKNGDKLTKIDTQTGECPSFGKYHFCSLLEYPGTYVIKCVSMPNGFKNFSDITFEIVQNEKGYPRIGTLEKNNNNLSDGYKHWVTYYDAEGSYEFWVSHIKLVAEKEENQIDSIVKTNVPIKAVYTVYETQEDGSIVPYGLDNFFGLDVKLYKMNSYNAWKNMYENTVRESAGGNDFIDNIRSGIKKEGKLVDEWTVSDYEHVSSLEEGLYAVIDDNVAGNGGYTFFEVNDKGQWREAAEHKNEYNPETGADYYAWTSPGEYGNEEPVLLVAYELSAYVNFNVVLKGKDGGVPVRRSQIEIYQKIGDELKKIDVSQSSYPADEGYVFTNMYDIKAFYPGTYVIKCVSVPDEYDKFEDITFTITRSKEEGNRGYPIFTITDANGNNVRITGPYEDGGYGYGAQESVPAVIEITLKDAGSSKANGASSNDRQKKSTAAQTGDIGGVLVWIICAASSVAIAGVTVYRKRKKG